ncbi:DUF4164 family protein [Leucobacter chironomi]|uniref:DUF4164 family protein n=1 Tax=Leucobacter chironomi TaxID=491918 RepID=UPI00137610A3|nr:DUF4164 family protein [Leucobacter chironomi]
MALLLSFAGGFAWMITRFDQRLDHGLGHLETKLTSRIDGVEARLSHRIDDVEARLSHRIDDVEARLTSRIDGVEARLERVESDVTEIKVTIARWEGPSRPPLLLLE